MSTANWFEFDPEEPLPEKAQEFLTALRQEAATWLDADPLDSQVYESYESRDHYLVLGMDVVNREEGGVLRSLRVDLSATGLQCGEDETSQFTTPLSPACDEYSAIVDPDASPRQLAQAAARWFREQMSRPVELLVWRDGSYWLRRWRLADSKRHLCWSASNNTVRERLGEPEAISPVRTTCMTADVGKEK